MDEEEKGPLKRTYSDADSAADLLAYRNLKRFAWIRSLVVVALASLVAARWLPVPALALAVGGVCGVLNALVTTHSTERVVDTGSVGGFVLSSFLRIGVFGIVPVAFAVRGPWWSMGWYFAGFFLPLALFAMAAPRAFQRK